MLGKECTLELEVPASLYGPFSLIHSFKWLAMVYLL